MDKVKLLFESMTYGTTYSFLDEGKDKDELEKIAKKRGIVLPSPDIAIFKGKYAFTDKQNKNRCTLPKEEVEKAINTLVGKAVDVDHLRKTVVGHWLDASLEEDTIITYGAFLKSNFSDEYADFKEKMEKGKVKISFEAWGQREYKGTSGGYDLKDIHFAGGALLNNEEPAFEDAEVLEFAKVLETGNPEIEITEMARFYAYDFQSILTSLGQVECLTCKEKGFSDLIAMDFEESKAKVRCYSCKAEMAVDLSPRPILTKKGRKIKQVQLASELIKKADEEIKNKGGLLKMEEKIKELEQSLAKMKIDLDTKIAEIATKSQELEDYKKVKDEELANIVKERDEAKTKLEEKLKAEKAAIVTARKTELGDEFSKGMTDEDILDEIKFENAKLKKKVSELEKSAKKIEPDGKTKITVGSASDEKIDDALEIGKRVQGYAWTAEADAEDGKD